MTLHFTCTLVLTIAALVAAVSKPKDKDSERIAALLHGAERETLKVANPFTRYLLKAEITACWLRSGSRECASRVFGQIRLEPGSPYGDPRLVRDYLLVETMVEAYLDRDDYQGALSAAKEINDSLYQSIAFETIALHAARAGNREWVARVCRPFPSRIIYVRTLCTLAKLMGQMRSKNQPIPHLVEAEAIASKAKHHEVRLKMLFELWSTHALFENRAACEKHGRAIDRILAAMALMNQRDFADSYRAEFIRLQANAHHFDAAFQSLQWISPAGTNVFGTRWRAIARRHIATALIRARRFDEVMDQLTQINDPGQLIEALASVANEYSHLSLWDRARSHLAQASYALLTRQDQLPHELARWKLAESYANIKEFAAAKQYLAPDPRAMDSLGKIVTAQLEAHDLDGALTTLQLMRRASHNVDNIPDGPISSTTVTFGTPQIGIAIRQIARHREKSSDRRIHAWLRSLDHGEERAYGFLGVVDTINGCRPSNFDLGK
jgi:hypothetical protein